MDKCKARRKGPRPHGRPARTAARGLLTDRGSAHSDLLRSDEVRAGETDLASPRTAEVLARADGFVRAQESSATSAACSLDSGHSRRLHGRSGKELTMRFGKWRGVPLSLFCLGVLGLGLATAATGGWLAPVVHDTPRGPSLRLLDRRRVLCTADPLWALRQGLPRRSGQGPRPGLPAHRLPEGPLGQDGGSVPLRRLLPGQWLRP